MFSGVVTRLAEDARSVRRASRRSLYCPLADLASRLTAIFPSADVRIGSRGVTVCQQGPHGYPVTVELVSGGVIVSFGPGLMEFDDVGTALSYVVMGCSARGRLRVIRNGASARRWKFEILDRDGRWRQAFGGGFSFIGGRRTGRRDEEVVLWNNRALPDRTSPAFDLIAKTMTRPAFV